MAADRTLRLVVLPDAATVGPMLELVRALVAQSLVEASLVFVDGDLGARQVGAHPDDDEVGQLRDWVETATCERFLVINLITADAITSGARDDLVGVSPDLVPELAATGRVDAFIRAALAAKVGQEPRSNQTLEVVNLVVPAATVGSVPLHLHTWGPQVAANPSGWRNVLVAPEVQETSLQAVVPVAHDEAYVAHIAASLLSITGVWAGATWDPELPPHAERGWTILRSRARALVAPELPIRILGRVGRTGSQIPISDRIEFELHPEPDQVVKQAVAEIVRRHKLDREAFADVGYHPPRKKVSIAEFFRILWAWLRGRLPQIVKGMVDDRVRAIRTKADAVLNAAVGLDADSDMEITFFRSPEEEEEAPPTTGVEESPEQRERVYTFLRPEPGLWHEMRAIAFGLLDGGDVPPPRLGRMLGEGNQRFVLGDRTWVTPPPGVPIWTAPKWLQEMRITPPRTNHVVDIPWADGWEHAFQELLPDPESEDPPDVDPDLLLAKLEFDQARERARRSFLWKLGEHLSRQRDEIMANLADLREQLEDALDPEGELEQQIAAEGKRSKRMALVRLIVSILLIAGFAAGGWWLVGVLALTGLALVAAVAVMAVVLLWGLVRSVWRCVYGWFLADHKMFWLRKGRVQVLEAAIAFDEIQLRRFNYLLYAQQEWCDIIATICFNPFRQPQPPAHRRIRRPELALPVSHQVAEGYTTAPRLDGIVSAVAAQLITPGWLTETFDSARTYAVEEHRIRTRGGVFDPDKDRNIAPDIIGPRRALKDAIQTGRARHRRELEVLREIHQSIRSGAGFIEEPTASPRPVVDRLFTPLARDREPSVFLGESVVGEPSNFNRDFVPFDRMPLRVASDQSDHVELPDLPTTEEMIEGATAEFPPVVFSAWGVELVEDVPAEDVAVFAARATPAAIDLRTALLLWVPPIDEDEGEVSPVEVEPSGWTVDPSELPKVGHLIVPDLAAGRRDGSGPYRFLMEEDGEPLSHRRDEPLPFTVREDCSPPGGVSILLRALQCVANRTGHSFTFVGSFRGLPPRRDDRIEVAWAFDEEFRRWQTINHPDYTGQAVGWGGPNVIVRPGGNARRRLSGGLVLLNADMKADPGFVGGFSHGNVLLHELGHVMNLHHVTDPREIMCASDTEVPSPLDYGPGDCTGFREIAIVEESA